MSKKNKRQNWRKEWTPEKVSRTAVHQSGVTACVGISPTNPGNDIIMLDMSNMDLTQWDFGKVTEQAINLWLEGKV